MKYQFSAQISAVITLSNEDFNYLFKVCQHHYDAAIQALAHPGSPLWGSRNRRNWDHGPDDSVELSFRQLDRLVKSLELERTQQGVRLYLELFRVLDALARENDKVNETYNVDNFNTQFKD